MTNKSIPADSLGARIRGAREEKEMTQLELANRVGISRAAVAQWEVNSTSPSLAKIEEIARALDVHAAWIAFGDSITLSQARGRSFRPRAVWLPEVDFGSTLDAVTERNRWGVPAEYLVHELAADPNACIVVRVGTTAVEPHYGTGDRAIVDRSDKVPSPLGTFLHWNGVGAAFANLQIVPEGRSPSVWIGTTYAEPTKVPFSKLTIIGRARARLQSR